MYSYIACSQGETGAGAMQGYIVRFYGDESPVIIYAANARAKARGMTTMKC